MICAEEDWHFFLKYVFAQLLTNPLFKQWTHCITIRSTNHYVTFTLEMTITIPLKSAISTERRGGIKVQHSHSEQTL